MGNREKGKREMRKLNEAKIASICLFHFPPFPFFLNYMWGRFIRLNCYRNPFFPKRVYRLLSFGRIPERLSGRHVAGKARQQTAGA